MVAIYKTKQGKSLEVRGEEPQAGAMKYTFILRESKACGENIEYLGSYNLHSPSYFIEKFIREN